MPFQDQVEYREKLKSLGCETPEGFFPVVPDGRYYNPNARLLFSAEPVANFDFNDTMSPDMTFVSRFDSYSYETAGKCFDIVKASHAGNFTIYKIKVVRPTNDRSASFLGAIK